MKIGIFGGSFNPPHKMHESIAKELLNRNILDKIIFVPTSNYYPKAGLISDLDRMKMLKLMIKNDERFEVSDYEFGRLTYTYETLEHFQKMYPKDDIYFVCGSDNLKELDTWKEYQKILNNFHLIVIPRKENIEDIINKYQEYRHHLEVVYINNNFLSSTVVRKYLQVKDYVGVKDYINEDVLSYIIKNKLYQLLEKDSEKS